MSNTSLKYTGKVDITVGRKTYSNYNSGHNNLFELLARFLAGETIDTLALPKYIKIERRQKGEDPVTDIVYSPMIAVRQAKRVDNNWATVISTVISDTNIINDEVEQNYQYDLILYSDDVTTELASIELSYDVLSQIQTGRQALIEWSLYITNEGESIR